MELTIPLVDVVECLDAANGWHNRRGVVVLKSGAVGESLVADCFDVEAGGEIVER